MRSAVNSPDDLAKRLADLSSADLARFTASLWSMAGRPAEAEGNSVLINPNSGAETKRYVIGEEPKPSDAAGKIVPKRSPSNHGKTHDLKTVDADQLYQEVLYAIDQQQRTVLFNQHIGCSPPDPPSLTKTSPRHQQTKTTDQNTNWWFWPPSKWNVPFQVNIRLLIVTILCVGMILGVGGTFLLPAPTVSDKTNKPADNETLKLDDSAGNRAVVYNRNATPMVEARPTCKRSPTDVTMTQLTAFRYNQMDPPSGILTVWAFLSDNTQRSIGNFGAFFREIQTSTEFTPLFNFRRAALTTLESDGRRAIQTVKVVTDDGITRFRWRLRKPATGSLYGCWMTTGIVDISDGIHLLNATAEQ